MAWVRNGRILKCWYPGNPFLWRQNGVATESDKEQWYNLNDSFDPYKAAYGSMPPHAEANPAIQQMYIDCHFCYAYKFGILTNGIVGDITFYSSSLFLPAF